VALESEIGGFEPVGRPAGPQERRRSLAPGLLAIGTLACPECDAPVAPGPRPLSPSDPIGCGFCGHADAVRDFLSLSQPTRPARVAVRLVS
jgi:hypothetical protein